jgi:hypothetical protein
MYLLLPLLLLFCSLQRGALGLTLLQVVAGTTPAGFQGFTTWLLCVWGSLKEVWPGHAVDVETAVVTAAGTAVEAGAVAHKVAC